MATSLCASKGGRSDSGNYCPGPNDIQCCVSGGGGGVTRDYMMQHAQDWVNRKVPYSQTATTDGYRQDCSGYVSMIWASSKPGHTTSDMENICHRISKSEVSA
jgi:hypothetical protein